MQVRGLQGIAGVVLALCRKVRSTSLLFGSERTEVDGLAVEKDGGRPLALLLVPMNAKKNATVTHVRGAPVLAIRPMIDIPQVGDPVVIAHAVDVVNLMPRPLTIYVQPSEAMPAIGPTTDGDLPVSARVDPAGSGPNWGQSAAPLAPYEHASFRIVVKKFAQAFCGKIGLSHEAVLSLIGQRPASVTSAARALSF